MNRELRMWDDPMRMCMQLQYGSEKVSMSYEMAYVLRKMIEDQTMERVYASIKEITGDCQ